MRAARTANVTGTHHTCAPPSTAGWGAAHGGEGSSGAR